jgi:aminoglycoside phosphotransferase family enzyme/predicted kinase
MPFATARPPAPDAAPTRTAVDPVRLRRSLGAAVELRETHVSWVFLTATTAVKVKKALRFDFADRRSLSARRDACWEEAEAIGRTAPRLAPEVRGVVPVGTGYALADPDHPGAVDVAVVTRLYDESATLAARLDAGTVGAAEVRAVGAVIARVHAGAQRVAAPRDDRTVGDRNLEGLAPLASGSIPAVAMLRARHAADAFVLREELAGHRRDGFVVDGHGDLRCEHVLLGGEIALVDPLDIPELRRVDVADDVAFLCADLEHRGHGDLVDYLLAGYAEGGGDVLPLERVAFHAAYRCLVRAKVALIRARQQGTDDGEAIDLVAAARRWAWRSRGPLVVLVCGPPASGKSTLARAIGAASGLPVLSSDLVRDPAAGYSDAARRRVYRDLGVQAAAHPAGCIVDATLGDRDLRQGLLARLQDHEVVAVECAVAESVAARRARERRPESAFGSEADEEVARRLAGRHERLDELPRADRILVDGEQPPGDIVEAIEAWLDRRLVRRAESTA